MKIKVEVRPGEALFSLESPVFIGTTATKRAPEHRGLFHFPPVGAMVSEGCGIVPIDGDWGTLVFDHQDPEQRAPLSATFYQFWWEGHPLKKLVVKEGLEDRRMFAHRFNLSPNFGLHFPSWEGPKQLLSYMTGEPSDPKHRKVGIIDMLLYLEGKIDLVELDERAIP